jgi:hypothetical protein
MRILVLLGAIALIGCGSNSGGGDPAAVVTLRSVGADPASLSLTGSAQIQFVNADAIEHQIASSDCPELASPRLASGGSFTATVGAGPKSCSFSDGLNQTATAFQGTVRVTQPTSGGGSYGY